MAGVDCSFIWHATPTYSTILIASSDTLATNQVRSPPTHTSVHIATTTGPYVHTFMRAVLLRERKNRTHVFTLVHVPEKLYMSSKPESKLQMQYLVLNCVAHSFNRALHSFDRTFIARVCAGDTRDAILGHGACTDRGATYYPAPPG